MLYLHFIGLCTVKLHLNFECLNTYYSGILPHPDKIASSNLCTLGGYLMGLRPVNMAAISVMWTQCHAPKTSVTRYIFLFVTAITLWKHQIHEGGCKTTNKVKPSIGIQFSSTCIRGPGQWNSSHTTTLSPSPYTFRSCLWVHGLIPFLPKSYPSNHMVQCEPEVFKPGDNFPVNDLVFYGCWQTKCDISCSWVIRRGTIVGNLLNWSISAKVRQMYAVTWYLERQFCNKMSIMNFWPSCLPAQSPWVLSGHLSSTFILWLESDLLLSTHQNIGPPKSHQCCRSGNAYTGY